VAQQAPPDDLLSLWLTRTQTAAGLISLTLLLRHCHLPLPHWLLLLHHHGSQISRTAVDNWTTDELHAVLASHGFTKKQTGGSQGRGDEMGAGGCIGLGWRAVPQYEEEGGRNEGVRCV